MLTVIIIIPDIFADDGVINIDRHGRRIEPDGFLLEWNQQEARQWGGAGWRWDAVNTTEGFAGYFTTASAQPCTAWTFSVKAKKTSAQIEVPGRMKTEIFAFDKGSFYNEGIYTVEWVVPWSFFGGNGDDISTYMMTLSGSNDCGDTLPPVTVISNRNQPPSSGSPIHFYGLLAVTAVITAIISAIKRSRRKSCFSARQ